MFNSLHRAFLSLSRCSTPQPLTHATERHYFDHKQASQVPHKPCTEATLLSSGLHSVKRGDLRTDRTNLSLRQGQSLGNSCHRMTPSCWIVVGFSHAGSLDGGTAIAI
jgi:hypothetical protein